VSQRGVAMSGHSKWATIKHKKGAQDKARGKLFAKLIRQIEVSAREGGSDIDANPTLRRSEEHTSELQSPCNLVCGLLLEKKNEEKENVLAEMVYAVDAGIPVAQIVKWEGGVVVMVRLQGSSVGADSRDNVYGASARLSLA